MYDRVMRHRHIIADRRLCLLVRAMDYGPILYVGIVADGDGMNVAPYHCIEPDRAAVAHCHIPHNGGVVGDEAVVTKLRGKSPYRSDQCHDGQIRFFKVVNLHDKMSLQTINLLFLRLEYHLDAATD